MKWLVQQLDILVSHRADNDGLSEQKRLEGLITRLDAIIVIAMRDIPNWKGGGAIGIAAHSRFLPPRFSKVKQRIGGKGEKSKKYLHNISVNMRRGRGGF